MAFDKRRQKKRVLTATDHEGQPVMWRICDHKLGFERHYPMKGQDPWTCFTRGEIFAMKLTESEKKVLDDLQFKPYRKTGEPT